MPSRRVPTTEKTVELIAAHAALPTVHQDAPALIATHTALPAAHHMQPKFTELEGLPQHYATNPDTWELWDLSAIVSNTAFAVLIGIQNMHLSHVQLAGARKYGSALNRKVYLDWCNDDAARWQVTLLTECDENQRVEIYADLTAYVEFEILGYWHY